MTANPLRILARFPRPVRLLLAGSLVNKLGTFIVPYLTLVLLRDFHMAEREAGYLIFAYGAGSLVSILTGGVLTDETVTPMDRPIKFSSRLSSGPTAPPRLVTSAA